MHVARHGSGLADDLRALGSQVHPVFMLPPIAATLFGGVVAGELAVGPAAVHAAGIFLAVYTAHLKDGYVDFYVRGEDDDHPLTAGGCRGALVASTLAFVVVLGALWPLAGPLAVVLTAPTWALGYFHAPQLDTNPVTATLGYPVGIGLAVLGGYAVQTGSLSPTILAFALVLVVVLAGVKVIDDETDYEYDRSIDKRTVAVVLGPGRARSLAVGLLVLGLIGVLWGTVGGYFPPSAPAAALVFGSVVLIARSAPPRLATMLLVRGAYLFFAVLVAAVWFRPLSGVGLVDITVLGPYTYLATELLFGAVALGLLVYADALRSAAKTIVALYPIAYVWDWYTLEVGVFAIELRTGYDLFGIPIEEHLFALRKYIVDFRAQHRWLA